MEPPRPQPPELDTALEALTALRPELRETSPELLGAGLDHDAYRLGDLVVRLGRAAGADLRREADLLLFVANRCPVPVPQPVAGGASWIAYPMLPGTPLLGCAAGFRARHAHSLAATLGALLAALWSTPPERAAPVSDEDATPPEAWRDEAAKHARGLAAELPSGVRPALGRFLAAPPPPPAARRLLTHNDLGAEHVLVDPGSGRLTGVIDWSDAAIADPAKDLGLVLRDLGSEALDIAMRAVGGEIGGLGDLHPRALFYARCLALEDLAYGLERDESAYVDSATAALFRLFRDATVRTR